LCWQVSERRFPVDFTPEGVGQNTRTLLKNAFWGLSGDSVQSAYLYGNYGEGGREVSVVRVRLCRLLAASANVEMVDSVVSIGLTHEGFEERAAIVELVDAGLGDLRDLTPGRIDDDFGVVIDFMPVLKAILLLWNWRRPSRSTRSMSSDIWRVSALSMFSLNAPLQNRFGASTTSPTVSRMMEKP